MRKFGPKQAGHPAINELCPLCDEPFQAGDFTTLLETEPANEEEAQRKAEGRVYTAAAREVHFLCAKTAAKLGVVDLT